MTTSLVSILLVVLSTFIAASGGFCLKKATSGDFFRVRYFFRDKLAVSGFGLYSLSSLVFIYALKNGQLSVLYPLASLAYIWIIFISWRFLNERISTYKLIGVIFIMSGVALLGLVG